MKTIDETGWPPVSAQLLKAVAVPLYEISMLTARVRELEQRAGLADPRTDSERDKALSPEADRIYALLVQGLKSALQTNVPNPPPAPKK